MDKKIDRIFKRKKIPKPCDEPRDPFFRKAWKEYMKRLIKEFNSHVEKYGIKTI